MSEDLIKRSDAIATIGVMYERCDTYDITDYRDLMLEAVKVLPSADRPQGEWIVHGEAPIYIKECSACGAKFFHHATEDLTPFCAMCGCRMKGADDE